MRHLMLSTTALCAALTLPASAQQAVDLGTLVLSGSLSPVAAAQTGATVEVITGDALQADGALRTTLDRQPGVTFSANGGLGANTTLRIRGLDTSYIGARFDGIDISDPSSTQTSFNFGGLTGAGLSRVEVLKGSQSALYGSEAIAGVVDITSWRPTRDGISGETRAEVGSFRTAIASASLGAASERGEVALSFGRVTSGGFSARAGDTEEDGYEETNLTFSAQVQATEALTLGATGFWRDSAIELDRSTSDNSGETSVEEVGWLVFGEAQAGAVRHRLSFSAFDRLRSDPGGATSRFEGARRELDYRAGFMLGAQMDADLRLTRTEEEIETPSIARREEVTESVSGELRWRPDTATSLSFALRHDDNSDFGSFTTGRVSLARDMGRDVVLRASLGTGYRAPSLFERFSSFGDPNLQPETSTTYEIGVEKTYGAEGFARATLFYTQIDDLIDFDGASTACGSGFGCYNQVPGQTVTQGLELSGAVALSDRLTLTGAYTYTDARTEDVRLPRVPRHDIVLGLDARLGAAWRGSAEVQHVADVLPSTFAPAANKVGNYTLVNLGLSRDIMDAATLYLRMENALDEDYETAGGFNTPGRSVHVGLRSAF